MTPLPKRTWSGC